MAYRRDIMILMVLIVGETMLLVQHGNTQFAGESYGISFMNISQEIANVGFIQIFGAATVNAFLDFEDSDGTYSSFNYLSVNQQTAFNVTYDYDQINSSSAVTGNHVDHLGIIVTSNVGVYVFGIKSDRGTTDGFMALPLLTTSTEFIIAGWPCDQFYAGFMLVAALNDTCFEVYQVNGSSYTLIADGYLQHEFDVYNYEGKCLYGIDEDVTGYYINTTQPVEVLPGHSCANVPVDCPYCDYMVESIPPINQLGTTYIVPPIGGRNDDGGFVVRVVATDQTATTTVNWSTADSSTQSGRATLTRGNFQEIDAIRSSIALLVICSRPCLVMQYNRGYLYSATPDIPTDPFMMLTVPIDHFDNNTAFATASFCGDAKVRQHFNNYVDVVTLSSNTASIMFDGASITGKWLTTTNGYSYISFSVSPGFHNITVTASNANFASYVYGHSLNYDSTSGYGYCTVYKMFGDFLTYNWQKALAAYENSPQSQSPPTCSVEPVYSGSAVATYDKPLAPVVHPFQLDVNLTATLTPVCLSLYLSAVNAQLLNISRYINYNICMHNLCPNLTGTQGAPIGGSSSGVSNSGVVYAAINTAALTNTVTFDYNPTTGKLTGLHITIPFTGVYNTKVYAFAQCRIDIRTYMVPFANWPLGNIFVPPQLIKQCGAWTVQTPAFVPNNVPCPSVIL